MGRCVQLTPRPHESSDRIDRTMSALVGCVEGLQHSQGPSMTKARPSSNERIFLMRMETSCVDYPVIQTQVIANFSPVVLPGSLPKLEQFPNEGLVIWGHCS